MLNILIEIGMFAEIAEVPVEGSVVFQHAGGDGGHNDVAAIPGVTGDGEGPVGVIRGGLRARGAAGIRRTRASLRNTTEPPIRHFIESPPEPAELARENASEPSAILSRDSEWMAMAKICILGAEFIWECARLRLHF